MSGPAKLEHLSITASASLAQCDSPIKQASNEGCLEAVVKRFLDRKNKNSYTTSPSSSQSVPRHSPSSITSVSLASNNGLNCTKHPFTFIERAKRPVQIKAIPPPLIASKYSRTLKSSYLSQVALANRSNKSHSCSLGRSQSRGRMARSRTKHRSRR